MSDSTRVAFVSGAAQGIGLKIALRLADDGLDVAVNDIPSKKAELEEVVSQIKAKGRRAIAITGDVSVEEDVRNAIDKVVADLGGLDVVSCNARAPISLARLTMLSDGRQRRTLSGGSCRGQYVPSVIPHCAQ